jgi:hypothetical protein
VTSMNVRDAISIAEGVALASSWIWLGRRQLSFSGWRSKASVASLGCVSLAVLLDLIRTSALQFVGLERVTSWVGLERLVSLTWGLFATMATLACLSLILAVLGKGSPRILALVWFCFLFIPNTSMLSSFGSALYNQWREAAPIRYRLAVLAGPGAINCGHVTARTDPQPSSKCVLGSFANHAPFHMLYDTQEIYIDSRCIDGLAGDAAGNLYDVEFSSRVESSEGIPSDAQLLDGGHIFVEPCTKPIILSKSIHNGLTCIPRLIDRTER